MITAETKGDQGGLDLGVDEQDWAAVKLLVDELEQELKGSGELLLMELRNESSVNPKEIGIRFEDFSVVSRN